MKCIAKLSFCCLSLALLGCAPGFYTLVSNQNAAIAVGGSSLLDDIVATDNTSAASFKYVLFELRAPYTDGYAFAEEFFADIAQSGKEHLESALKSPANTGFEVVKYSSLCWALFHFCASMYCTFALPAIAYSVTAILPIWNGVASLTLYLVGFVTAHNPYYFKRVFVRGVQCLVYSVTTGIFNSEVSLSTAGLAAHESLHIMDSVLVFDILGHLTKSQAFISVAGLASIIPHSVNTTNVGSQVYSTITGACVLVIQVNDVVVPIAQGIVGFDGIMTASHVIHELADCVQRGLKVYATKMTPRLDHDSKYVELLSEALADDLKSPYVIAAHGYEQVSATDMAYFYLPNAAARLGHLRPLNLTTDNEVRAHTYNYVRSSCKTHWVLLEHSGVFTDAGGARTGLCTHTSNSVPGCSGGLVRTRSGDLAGMMLGVSGEDNVAASSEQLKTFCKSFQLFDGNFIKWPKNLPTPTITHARNTNLPTAGARSEGTTGKPPRGSKPVKYQPDPCDIFTTPEEEEDTRIRTEAAYGSHADWVDTVGAIHDHQRSNNERQSMQHEGFAKQGKFAHAGSVSDVSLEPLRSSSASTSGGASRRRQTASPRRSAPVTSDARVLGPRLVGPPAKTGPHGLLSQTNPILDFGATFPWCCPRGGIRDPNQPTDPHSNVYKCAVCFAPIEADSCDIVTCVVCRGLFCTEELLTKNLFFEADHGDNPLFTNISQARVCGTDLDLVRGLRWQAGFDTPAWREEQYNRPAGEAPETSTLDSLGNRLLIPIFELRNATTGTPNRAPKKITPEFALLTETIADEFGLNSDYTFPDTSARGIYASLHANSAKRCPRVRPTGSTLVTNSDALRSYLESVPDKSDYYEDHEREFFLHASVCDRVTYHMSHVNLTKSAGWTGEAVGKATKGQVLETHYEDVHAAACERLSMLSTISPITVSTMSAEQLVRYGLRDPVMPSVKNEGHPDRKVWGPDGKKMQFPRWRTILVQSLVDEIVGRVLHKASNDVGVRVYQQATAEVAARCQSTLGAGAHDAGISRLAEVTLAAGKLAREGSSALYPEHIEVDVVTSDVSGMDWCFDAIHGAVDVARRLRELNLLRIADGSDEQRITPLHRAIANYGLVVLAPMYLVGNLLFEQTVRGVNQTGVVSTGAFNTTARAYAEHELYAEVHRGPMFRNNAFVGGRVPLPHGDDNLMCEAKGSMPTANFHKDMLEISGLDLRDLDTQSLLPHVGHPGHSYLSMLFGPEVRPQYTFLNQGKCLSKIRHKGTITQEELNGYAFCGRYTPSMSAWIERLRVNQGLAPPVLPVDANVFDLTVDDE